MQPRTTRQRCADLQSLQCTAYTDAIADLDSDSNLDTDSDSDSNANANVDKNANAHTNTNPNAVANNGISAD